MSVRPPGTRGSPDRRYHYSLAKYSARIKIPSCTVGRRLLTDIEAYILSRWEDFDPQERPNYYFAITDPIGTETIPNVADYSPSLFPDDSQEATLSLSAPKFGQQLSSLRVSFAVDRISSTISINLNGPNARELAKGIVDGVLGYVRPWQNYNGLLHPTAYGMAVVRVGSAGAGGCGCRCLDGMVPQ